MENTVKVLEEIKQERINQNEKWVEQNHSPMNWLPILMEELGEASKEALDHHFKNPVKYTTLTYKFDREPTVADQKNRLYDYRQELIQLTAVTVQAIECFDRNENSNDHE